MGKNNHTEYLREYRRHRVHRVVIFSKDEYTDLLESSIVFGKPFSTHVRELALAQLSKNPNLPTDEQSRKIQVLLTRFGTNLNQIAHVANSTYHVPSGVLEEVLVLFKKMKSEVMNVYQSPEYIERAMRETIQRDPSSRRIFQKILNDQQ